MVRGSQAERDRRDRGVERRTLSPDITVEDGSDLCHLPPPTHGGA